MPRIISNPLISKITRFVGMIWPSTRIGQFLTMEVHKIVLSTGVAIAKFTSKVLNFRQQALAKQYDTNECVAPKSKRTKALLEEMGRVPVTTSFDAAASLGVKAYTRAGVVVLCPSGQFCLAWLLAGFLQSLAICPSFLHLKQLDCP